MIIGHDKVIEDLKRLAKGDGLAHGYIFFGPSMVGKRSMALAFANLLERGEFTEPKFLTDGLVIQAGENGTIGIDAVRQIKYFLWQRPRASERRTVIIDCAELMTPEAQNAILKVAEEPPPSTLLILVTSDPDGLLPTVSSRLEKLYFPTVPEKLVTDYIKKTFSKECSPEAIARKSFGKLGLAHRLVEDKEFSETLKTADNLLKLKGEERKDFIKKLLKSDDFDLNKLLDAVILGVSSVPFRDKNRINFWHKLLELRHDSAYFNLNPRLQLENLLAST